MNLTIRPAQQTDVENIVKLIQSLSLLDNGRTPPLSTDVFIRDSFGDAPAFCTMLAEENGLLAGYAFYYWGYDTHTATRGVYLVDLYVVESHRRCGVGTRLMNAVSRATRESGGRWIFWSVLKRNKAARSFYRQLAPELEDVLVCAAVDGDFDRLAGAQ